MQNHNIFIHRSAQEQAACLATTIIRQIEQAGQEGRRFLLGCPGGRSPFQTYEKMAAIIAAKQLDIAHLVIVMMDDYVLKKGEQFIQCDKDAHYSCRRFALEDIQNRLNQGIPKDKQVCNVWFPPLDEPEDYDRRLTKAGGIDHFILASGASDGHVAFNPPSTPHNRRSHIATLSLQTRTDNLSTFPAFNHIDEVPQYGLTVGLATIKEQSKEISLIINGSHKKAAAKRLLSLDGFDLSWPVSIIHECDNVNIYLDHACNPLGVC